MISIRERIQRDRILSICRNFYKPLLNKANVVGVGMGYKQIKNFQTNQLCIHVLVKEKLLSSYIAKSEIIPNIYMGFKTDVIETGEIIQGVSNTTVPPLLVDRVRPLIAGYCIMAGGIISGTLGCIVKKRIGTRYDYYILGNNHILSDSNKLPIGAPIIQPSSDYGGDPVKDKVAELTKYIPTKVITRFHTPTNYVDCAIAKILDVNNISNTLALEGPIKGVSSAGLGDPISKVGMITGLTNGVVNSVGVTAKVKLIGSTDVALFKDITRADIRNSLGDSGALVINPRVYGVGLYFASASPMSAFYCSLIRCLHELDVTLYTG